MSNDFKPGDIVELNSGGPKMTVKKLEQWDGLMRAHCDWFEGSTPKYATFPVVSLKRISI